MFLHSIISVQYARSRATTKRQLHRTNADLKSIRIIRCFSSILLKAARRLANTTKQSVRMKQRSAQNRAGLKQLTDMRIFFSNSIVRAKRQMLSFRQSD